MEMLKCRKCKRFRPRKIAKGWMVKKYANGKTEHTCTGCIKPDQLLEAAHLNGERGFMYDPKEGTVLSRPRTSNAELNRFDCACGWILVDAAKAYMVGIALHRRECPEGARRKEDDE